MAEKSRYYTCARAYPDKPPARIGDSKRVRVRADCPRRRGWGKRYVLSGGGLAACQDCGKYKPQEAVP